MRAMSPLGTVAAADDACRELLERQHPAPHAIPALGRGRAAIRDLATVYAAAAPLPFTERVIEPDLAGDRLLVGLLESRYESGFDVQPESDVRETLGDRLSIVDGRAFVPLARDGPAAENWFPTAVVLIRALESVGERVDRVAVRLRGADALAREACSSLAAMLGSVRDSLERAVATDRAAQTDLRPAEPLVSFGRDAIRLLDADYV